MSEIEVLLCCLFQLNPDSAAHMPLKSMEHIRRLTTIIVQLNVEENITVYSSDG